MGKKSGVKQATPNWTFEEHRLFLEALEKYGYGTTGNEWKLMSEYVGTRNTDEIIQHAEQYYLLLQEASSPKKSMKQNQHVPLNKKQSSWKKSKTSSYSNNLPMNIDSFTCQLSGNLKVKSPLQSTAHSSLSTSSTVDQMTTIETSTNWTAQEDKIFENALATYASNLSDRWERISSLIPGKSSNDVYQRYQTLVDDVSLIEAGNNMNVKYAGSSLDEFPPSYASPSIGSMRASASSETTLSPQKKAKTEDNNTNSTSNKSSIMPSYSKKLNGEEERLLLAALQETRISKCYSPVATASIEQAVASLSSKNSQKNSSIGTLENPSFSKDIATTAVKKALEKVESIVSPVPTSSHKHKFGSSLTSTSTPITTVPSPMIKSMAIDTISNVLRLNESSIKEHKTKDKSTCSSIEEKERSVAKKSEDIKLQNAVSMGEPQNSHDKDEMMKNKSEESNIKEANNVKPELTPEEEIPSSIIKPCSLDCKESRPPINLSISESDPRSPSKLNAKTNINLNNILAKDSTTKTPMPTQ